MFKEKKFLEQSQQKEYYSSKIKLHFCRHADKENDKTKSDNEIRLTKTGRGQSIKESSELKSPTLARAIGSSKIRAQETAALVMDAKTKGIKSDQAFDNFEDWVSKGLMGQSRIIEDNRLNFELDTNSEFGKISLAAFKKGEYLKFLVEDSNELYEKLNGSEKNSTYSKSAANIASIVKNYFDASIRWDNTVSAEETRKYPKNYKDLERFFGSHQGVEECFLAKIIEEIKGVDKRNKFVKILKNQGFDFVEGYDIDIITKNNNTKILIMYQKKDEDGNTLFDFNELIDIDLLEKIIKEGKKINKK